jgi:hypothetical protein
MKNYKCLTLGTMLLIAVSASVIQVAAQAIAVSSPANNSQLSSPVHYVASATSPQCAMGIAAMRIYLAPHIVAYNAKSSSIDTKLSLTPGNYKTVVQAWDNCGNVKKTALNFTVTAPSLKPVRFVYVGDRFSKIWGFTADPSTGVLTPTAQGPVLLNNGFGALAADKGGFRLYATFGDTVTARGWVYAYFIDRRNGRLSPVPGSPFLTAPWTADAITVHPSGKLVFVATESPDFLNFGILVFAVNSNGSLTAVNTTPIPTSSQIARLVADRSGKYLYALQSNTSSIEGFAVDTVSGALTPLPGSPYILSPGRRAIDLADSYGRFLYTSNIFTESISGFAIAGKTGTLKELAGSPFAFPAEHVPDTLALEPTGRFLYDPMQGSGVAIYSINAGNGALTLVKALFLSGVIVAAKPVSDPSGKFLYFLTGGGNTSAVGAFSIAVSGDLMLLPFQFPLGTPSDARDLVVTP